ncbi:MAG: LacI family DNA-binding transcriptional regulator [Pseudomonadota bacterium]
MVRTTTSRSSTSAHTIRDVARIAGVSVATVSRALNGHENVTPETKARILAVAKELRFAPSGAARSLITRRNQAIGAVLPDLHGEYFSELIRGIDLAARAHDLYLLVSSSHGDSKAAANALHAMRGRVDGLLVLWPGLDAEGLDADLSRDTPTVLINTHSRKTSLPSLAVDNHGGAMAMVQHLVSLGHKRIAFITGPDNNYEARERLRGSQEAAAEAGVQLQVIPGDFNEASGHAAGRRIAQQHERPTAVFAGNDMMAIGCLSALSEAGLRVPQDISLAGFDDIPIARYITPSLTTVRARIADLGQLALERLVAEIEGNTRQAVLRQTLGVDLIVRHSTAPVPKRAARA